MTTAGLTAARARAGAASPVSMARVRSSSPSAPPGSRMSSVGSKRAKWMDTPAGAIRYISGSTVGLPGGTSTPMRPRHPFMVHAPPCDRAPARPCLRVLDAQRFGDEGRPLLPLDLHHHL